MTFDVRWVRYGRPAAEALREAISQAKGDEPLNPVTVLVPSNHVGVAARRMLASGKLGPICSRGAGIVAVDFLTPYRLAELLGAARLAGSGRRPVSTPVIAAALRASLNEDPGLFRPVASHPATESALTLTGSCAPVGRRPGRAGGHRYPGRGGNPVTPGHARPAGTALVRRAGPDGFGGRRAASWRRSEPRPGDRLPFLGRRLTMSIARPDRCGFGSGSPDIDGTAERSGKGHSSAQLL